MGISAVIASAVISAGSSSIAASKARKASRKANRNNINENRRQYDQTREDLSSYRASGETALNNLQDPGANFEASPDYEFRRSEGLRDTGNMFAMTGGGGNAMKAITGYSSDLASGEFNNWFQRQFQLSEQGRGATGTVAQAGENMASRNQGSRNNMAGSVGQSYYDQGANINNAMNSGISNYLYGKKTGQIGGDKAKYDFQGREIQYN